MNLFELFVKIGVDDQASGKLSNLSSKLGNGLKTAAKAGAAAMAAIGTATVAAGTAFANNIKQTAEYADNIDKMSQKMGLSAQAYQEWDFIMQHSGTSMEALKAGMKTLANAVENGNDAFERLGITQEEIATMNQEKLFARTLEGLQGVTDETERTYLAGQLLGRGATELGALLNTSAEDVEAMRQQVHDLGGVMSDEAVKAGAAFQDSLQNLGVATSSLGRNLSSQFLPSVTSMMDGLSALITGDESGFALIETGINDFIGNLANQLPKFLEMGAKIVENLATAILDNIPVLFESGVSIITELLTSAIGMLPQIVQLGFDLIVSLANGIAQNIGFIIPTVVSVIMKIAEILTNSSVLQDLLDVAFVIIKELAWGLSDAIPQLTSATNMIIEKIISILLKPENISALINAAVQIILALGSGLINTLPELARHVDRLIMTIIAQFKDADWRGIGKNLVAGFKSGIQSAWSNLRTWFSGLFGDLKSIAKNILGIRSPSKEFQKLGSFTAEGFGLGFQDEFANVKDDMEDAMTFDDPSIGINASIRKVGAGAATGAYGGASFGDITINIDGAKYSDEQSLAVAIAQEIQSMTDRRTAVYA